MTTAKNKKLNIPSFKKSISDFLKNESGSVSTKSAMAVGVMGAAGVGLSGAVEGYCEVNQGHYNLAGNGVYNGSGPSGATITNVPNQSCTGQNVNFNYKKGCSTISCIDAQGIVNGHYNAATECSSSAITKHCNHVSSGDSGDSGDGGDSCG